jgi:hypothetical protein
MENLIIPGTDFTPRVNFILESGNLELSGISRPEDVAGFYNEPLNWLAELENSILNKSGFKYEITTINFVIKLSYFNSSSSKYLIMMLRHLKNLIEAGIQVKVDWYFEEGDEKMQEDGEDLAEAVELEFNYLEMED